MWPGMIRVWVNMCVGVQHKWREKTFSVNVKKFYKSECDL